MSQSSDDDDEIEVLFDPMEDDGLPLTEDQIRQLNDRWTIHTLYDDEWIRVYANMHKMSIPKIKKWDAERRRLYRRDMELQGKRRMDSQDQQGARLLEKRSRKARNSSDDISLDSQPLHDHEQDSVVENNRQDLEFEESQEVQGNSNDNNDEEEEETNNLNQMNVTSLPNQAQSNPLSRDQIELLEEIWPIEQVLEWPVLLRISRDLNIPLLPMVKWDLERKERRDDELALAMTSQEISSQDEVPNNNNNGTQDIDPQDLCLSQTNSIEENLLECTSSEEDEYDDQNGDILSSLHVIFPKGDSKIDPSNFPGLVRQGIFKNRLRQTASNFTLLIFVDQSIPGDTAAERLKNLAYVTSQTCIPMYIGSFSHCKDTQVILEYLRKNSQWKYLKFFDIYQLKVENHLIHNVRNAPSTTEYRRQSFLSILMILASRVVQSQKVPQYSMEFINTKDGCQLIGRYINHVENDDMIGLVRNTLDNEISLLCPHLTSENCGEPECRHMIHFDQLDLLHEVDKNLDLDDREGIPAALYRVQTFNLGDIFLPAHHDLNNHLPPLSQEERNNELETHFEEFRRNLDSYRQLQKRFYVYIVIGAHVDDKSQAPSHLDLNVIQNDLKAYIYVGRSKYSGIPLHHFIYNSTKFAQTIREKKLNMFWILRNIKCASFQDSELQEAIYQVMLMYVKKVSRIRNLVYVNMRLECSALDFASNAQLQAILEMVRQPGFQFIYNSVDEIPAGLDFNFLQKPLILNESRRFFL